jgi:hypothetical protein
MRLNTEHIQGSDGSVFSNILAHGGLEAIIELPDAATKNRVVPGRKKNRMVLGMSWYKGTACGYAILMVDY